MPDGLDPAGCLGLRNSNPSCRAEPFRSGAVVDERARRLGVVCAAAAPGFVWLGVMLPHLGLLTLSLLTLMFCSRETWRWR